jgi:inorganic pyrophosphatase
MDVDMLVEIPAGSRNKYEMDHTTGRIRLDRTLATATAYPTDYGYIPDTVAEDGHPLNAMVLDVRCAITPAGRSPPPSVIGRSRCDFVDL